MRHDSGSVRFTWFPQIKTVGVQVGSRLRNGSSHRQPDRTCDACCAPADCGHPVDSRKPVTGSERRACRPSPRRRRPFGVAEWSCWLGGRWLPIIRLWIGCASGSMQRSDGRDVAARSPATRRSPLCAAAARPEAAAAAVGKTAAGNWGNGIVARGEPSGAKWPSDIRSVHNA